MQVRDRCKFNERPKEVLARISIAFMRDLIYIHRYILRRPRSRIDDRKLIRRERERDPSLLPRWISIRTVYVTLAANVMAMENSGICGSSREGTYNEQWTYGVYQKSSTPKIWSGYYTVNYRCSGNINILSAEYSVFPFFARLYIVSIFTAYYLEFLIVTIIWMINRIVDA